MQQNEQITTQSTNFNVGKLQEIEISAAGKILKECSDEEIRAVLRNIFILIGLPANKLPIEDAKTILIEFIRRRLWNVTIEEMNLAFIYALEKKFRVDWGSYSDTFSPKMVAEVVQSFLEYKKAILKNKPKETEAPMINTDKAFSILSMLPKETIDKLKEIGKAKPEERKREKLPYHDFYQQQMKQFDFLRRNFSDSSGRFVFRYGETMSISRFVEYKSEQLLRVKEYLNERGADLL
jgi:hypothetical protein